MNGRTLEDVSHELEEIGNRKIPSQNASCGSSHCGMMCSMKEVWTVRARPRVQRGPEIMAHGDRQ